MKILMKILMTISRSCKDFCNKSFCNKSFFNKNFCNKSFFNKNLYNKSFFNKPVITLQNPCKGFTLVELVIVLGIIALIGTTAVATSRGIQRRTLNNASMALKADFRWAQRMALIEGRRWEVRFDRENHRYFIRSDNRDRTYIVYLPNGVEITFLTHTFLEYLPRGTVSSGFRIHLRNGPYLQELTANVTGGRILIHEIERLAG